LLTALAGRAAATPLSVCLDENPWPPYSYLQENPLGGAPVLRGYTAELATRALRAMALDWRLVRLPWAEVHHRARSPDGDARCDLILDISATPERESYLAFTDPIYKLRYSLMYDRKRFPGGSPLQRRADLKTWKTCGVKDYNYGALPEQVDLRRADSIQDALDRLQRRQCDFFLIEASVLERGGAMGLYRTGDLDCVELEGMSKAYRLAVSKQADNAGGLLGGLKQALDQLRRDGIQARLAGQYRVNPPACREKLD
jgi:ABC-type amino acid transport substrate-binding protein